MLLPEFITKISVHKPRRGLGKLFFLKGQVVNISGAYPGGSDGEEPGCNAGDPGSIPGLRKSPGEGNGNPLQYSCQENSMDREAWQATVCGVTESDTTG